jgi:hypothetical protein
MLLFHLTAVRSQLQDHLDDHARRSEASICEEVVAVAPLERPFAMTGLYDLIPEADPSPLRMHAASLALRN